MGHAQSVRLLGHYPGKLILAARQVFGDGNGNVICRFGNHRLDGVLDRDGLARLEAELGRGLLCSMGGDLQRRVEPDPPGIELLEQEVERHDLGQRGGVTHRIGVRRLQHLAAVAVDDQRGEGRRVFFGVTAAVVDMRDVARVMHVEAAVVPRISCVAGDEETRCEGGKTKDAIAKPAPGLRTHPSHHAPRP